MPQREVSVERINDISTSTAYEYSAVANANKEQILSNSDTWDMLTNPALRSFSINKVLSGAFTQSQTRLTSYSALPVQNLQIQARLKGSDHWFVLGTLDSLPAFSKLNLSTIIRDGTPLPRADVAGSVRLTGLNAFTQLPQDVFDIRIDSKTDVHVQKLNNIKPKWFLYFGKYDETPADNWGKINPYYAREWVILMTNFAWMLSTPEFEYLWFHHKEVMGHDFFGNAGRVDGPGGFFTATEYRTYYDQIMNRGGISLGVTTMGGGLGGEVCWVSIPGTTTRTTSATTVSWATNLDTIGEAMTALGQAKAGECRALRPNCMTCSCAKPACPIPTRTPTRST